MGILSVLRRKAPERYEDIAAPGTKRLGWFRKWRLIWFLAGRPDEAERYRLDFEAKLFKRVGSELFSACMRNPLKVAEELRKERRELLNDIRAVRREQRGLLSVVKERIRILDRMTAGRPTPAQKG